MILFFTLGLLGKFGMGLGALLLFLVQWWYMVLFEVLNQGRTRENTGWGCASCMTTRTPVGWTSSLTRNLLRFVDLLPFGYFLGALSCLANPAFKRLGDTAAGTLVVYREKTRCAPTTAGCGSRHGSVQLTLDEQRALLALPAPASLSAERRLELASIWPSRWRPRTRRPRRKFTASPVR